MTDRRYLPPSEYGGAVAGTASADVESANICGYQNVDVPKGYSFRTVTFKEVANSDDSNVYDLLDIHPLQADGSEYAASGASACNGAVKMNLMSDTLGHYGDVYQYFSTTTYDGAGWYLGAKKSTSKKITRGTVFLKKGEGIIFNCTKASKLLLAGEVELTDTTFALPKGYSFSGNNTPVTIDLLDITPLQADGTPFAASGASACNGACKVNKMSDTLGHYDDVYQYFSTTTYDGAGWYLGAKKSTSKKLERGVVTFNPGEGFLCNTTKALMLEMPKAVTK